MVWVGPGRSCESGSARAWADEGRGITECSHVTASVLLVRIEPIPLWPGVVRSKPLNSWIVVSRDAEG